MLQRGDIAARSAARSGAIWGNVANQIGQIAGGAIQQHGERKSEEQRTTAIGEALGSFGADPKELYRRLVDLVGSEDALAITKARVSLDGITDQKDAENQRRLNDVMEGAAKLPYDVFAEGYAGILEKAAPGLRAFEFFDVPPEPTPEFHQQLQQWTAKSKEPEALVDTVDAEGNPVRRRPTEAEVTEGVPLWKKPDTAEAPLTGEAAYIAGLERAKGAPLTPQERLQAHAQYATSGQAPAAAAADEDESSPWGTASSEAERKRVSVTRYGLGKLDDWEKWAEANQDLIGPIEGPMTIARQAAGIGASRETGKKKADMAILRNAILNALSGAAVNPQEFERLREQVPELQDSYENFMGKLDSIREYFTTVLNEFGAPRAISGGPGASAQPDLPTLDAATAAAMKRLEEGY